MARIIGLDLGSYSVKALVLEAAFRGSTVKRFAEVRLVGDDRQAALKSALAHLSLDRGLAADQLAVAIPGFGVATQVITLPFKNERQVEQTLPSEVEVKMEFDLAEIAYDYQALASPGDKSDLLVGAVRTEEMQRLLDLLKEYGIDPRVVTLPSLVYSSLFATGLGAPDAVHAIVDIGHERVSVAIGTALGGCELARTLGGGGLELTRAIANDFKVNLAEAQDWKERLGDVSDRQTRTSDEQAAYNALLRGLSGMVRELRQTFRANQAKFRHPVTRVHLCGGTAKLRGLTELLSKELGVPVGLLHSTADLGGAVAQAEVPVAAQAFALAQRANQGASGTKLSRFNLRRGAFAFKGDFEYLKGKLGRLGAFAGILLALAGLNSYVRLQMLSQRETVLDDKLCESTQKVLGKCERDFSRALSMLREHNAPASAIPQVSAVELLAETANHIPDETNTRITEAEITLSRLRLRGTVDSFDSVDKLTQSLKGYKCFSAINRGKVEKDQKDPSRIAFTLDIEVGCGAQNTPQG
jgi:general secretion pathway protein L